jgi:hypothetical protein
VVVLPVVGTLMRTYLILTCSVRSMFSEINIFLLVLAFLPSALYLPLDFWK